MINYEKPSVIANEDIVEGVYLASGCYTATARITQSPQTGRGNYVIQVDAKHQSDHTTNKQKMTMTFNQSVTCTNPGGNGGTVISSGGTTLVVQYSYWNNPNDNIGFGNLTVESEAGLAILSVSMDDMDH